MEILIPLQVKAQIDNIIDDVEERFGSNVARTVRSNIQSTIIRLSSSPRMGHPDFRFTERENVRLYSTKHNHILYQIYDGVIIILGFFETGRSPETIKREVTRMLTNIKRY